MKPSKSRFTPTRRALLWPPADRGCYPDRPLAPLPTLPPCPVRLGSCVAGDRVLLAQGTEADVTYVSPCAVTLRPTGRTTRTIVDRLTGEEHTFTAPRPAYHVAPNASCQAVVGHSDLKPEKSLRPIRSIVERRAA